MLSLTITTVDKQLFSGDVYAAVVPGSEGELTVLGGHEPFITTLSKGTIRVLQERGGEAEVFPVERGLLEVSVNGAVVLL